MGHLVETRTETKKSPRGLEEGRDYQRSEWSEDVERKPNVLKRVTVTGDSAAEDLNSMPPFQVIKSQTEIPSPVQLAQRRPGRIGPKR